MTPCDYCSGTRSLSDQPALGPCVCAPWTRVEHLAPGVTLYCGDSLEVLPALVGRHDVASVVTDPPYGLGAHPDPRELLRCWWEGRPYAAKGAGFMGKEWDAFVPGPEIWRPVMDLLPPGGHMLAAFGTRTYDLGTLAVRLADAEIRDLIAWVYGSGFPKSLDVSKAIDKAAGAEREVVGTEKRQRGGSDDPTQSGGRNYRLAGGEIDITAPATDAARQWDGWGTALKPAIEPWVLARKPLAGTVAANILAHGVGALNIDACRVRDGTETGGERPAYTPNMGNAVYGTATHGGAHENTSGRWPANVIHDGSDEVLAGFPETGGGDKRGKGAGSRPGGFGDVGAAAGSPEHCGPTYADTGSAARFFYCAKASKRDRDEGMGDAPGVTTDDGRGETLRKNHHPTVKPEALMAYLCRLITPPGGTVLDPFMGSGSTGKAAVRAGFGFVGIERDPAYFEIAVRRVRAALDASVTTCDADGQD